MTARLAMAAGVLALLAFWTHARPQAADVPPVDFAAAIPFSFGEWVGRDAPPLDPDVARVLAADRYLHRYYARRGDRGARLTEDGSRIADVELDIAYYVRPQAGAAMHSPLNCLPGNGWQVIESRVAPVTVAGRRSDVRRIVVARASHRLAMTYWFQNRGAVAGNEYRQRLQLLKNGLQGNPTDAALVRVMALDTPEGHLAMQQFTPAIAAKLAATFH